MAGEVAGVGRADGEDDLVAGVGVQGFGHLAGELAEVLVGQDQGQPVGAGLAQGVVQADGQVQEVVGLIDVAGGVGCARGRRSG